MIPLSVILSQQIFAHATAVVSCTKFCSDRSLYQNRDERETKFPSNLNCDGKTVIETGPWYDCCIDTCLTRISSLAAMRRSIQQLHSGSPFNKQMDVLFVRSHEVSKPLWLGVLVISLGKSKPESRGLETSRDLTVRRPDILQPNANRYNINSVFIWKASSLQAIIDYLIHWALWVHMCIIERSHNWFR